MKTRNLLTVALAFLALAASVSASNNRAPSYAAQIVNPGISLNQQISSSSLSSASSITQGQFVINKSGRYFLSTDILAAPARNLACIYIAASDVVLDLGGKTLTLSTTSNQKNSAAIEIAGSVTDITIMNGTLNGRSGSSSVYTTTGIKIGSSVSNVLLDNVHVVNFANDGINFGSSCSDIILNNIHTYNIGLAAKSVAAALTLTSCNDVTIIDSTFNKTNMTSDVNVYGIYASGCNNLGMNNVQISNTTGVSGSVRGIYLSSCTGVMGDAVKILRCTAGTANASPVVAGIDMSATTGCTFVNCIANNGSSTHFTTSTYGFRLASGSNSNTLINCEAKGNFGGGTTCAFNTNASHFNTFKECSAIGNGSSTTHTTYGFQSGLYSAVNATDMTASCSGNSFKACKINSNIAGLGHTYGIDLAAETGSSIQECEIKANTAGAICYGIAMHHNCIRNVVEYNKIYSNKGAYYQYGLKDFATDCSSLLRGNVSFGHGATFSGGNASLTDSPVAGGGMNYMLSFTESVGQMNIQFLIKEGDIANMNSFEVGSPNWFNFSILHNSFAG